MCPLVAQVVCAEERYVGIAAEFPDQFSDLLRADQVVGAVVAFGIFVERGPGDRHFEECP